MNEVTGRQRVYFAAVGLLALWVGVWGYFIPSHADVALPWLVPPLHARFLGAIYLSGATFMVGSLLARLGKTNARGEVNLLQLAVIGSEIESQTFGVGIPISLQRLGLRVLAGLGRQLGYQPRYT